MKCKHKNCKYRAQLGNNIEFCDYIGHTKQSRDCDPAKCDKYKKKTKVRALTNIVIPPRCNENEKEYFEYTTSR